MFCYTFLAMFGLEDNNLLPFKRIIKLRHQNWRFKNQNNFDAKVNQSLVCIHYVSMSHLYHYRTLQVRQSFICYRDHGGEVASRETKRDHWIIIQYVFTDVIFSFNFCNKFSNSTVHWHFIYNNISPKPILYESWTVYWFYILFYAQITFVLSWYF